MTRGTVNRSMDKSTVLEYDSGVALIFCAEKTGRGRWCKKQGNKSDLPATVLLGPGPVTRLAAIFVAEDSRLCVKSIS